MSSVPAALQGGMKRRDPWSRRRTAVAVTLAMTLSGAARAQSDCSNGGGNASWRNFLLTHSRQVFTSKDSAARIYRRKHGISVPDTILGRIVTEQPVCAALRPHVRKALKSLFVPEQPLDSFELIHFQFGKYDAVLLSPILPPGARTVNGYEVLLIFHTGTFEYIGFVLS